MSMITAQHILTSIVAIFVAISPSEGEIERGELEKLAKC